jgi:hypothetical protein
MTTRKRAEIVIRHSGFVIGQAPDRRQRFAGGDAVGI